MDKKSYVIMILLVMVLLAQTFALEKTVRQSRADMETIHSLRDALDYSERVRARCQSDLEHRPAREQLATFKTH